MAGESQYGGFWIRFFAFMVDAAILIVAGIALGISGSFLGAVGATLGATLYVLLQIAYAPVMHASARQATFGKALLGLKVVHADTGERITILRAIGRDVIGKLISGLVFMIGFLMAAFTGRKQALHDLLATTMVVREGPAHVAAAAAVAVVGLVGPMIAIPLFGIALMTGMMAAMTSAMVGDMKKEMNKAAAKPAIVARAAPARTAPPKPAPALVAEVPRPVPPPAAVPASAPTPVAAAPAPMPTLSPVPVKAAPPPSAPAKIAVAAPAVPAEAAPKPKLAPTKMAAASRPAAAPVLVSATASVAPLSSGPNVTPGPKYGDLMSAVMARDAGGVQELLDFGKWADKPSQGGTTPLMVAVSQGDAASAEALLKAGADAGKAVSTARGDKAMLGLLQRYGATLPRP